MTLIVIKEERLRQRFKAIVAMESGVVWGGNERQRRVERKKEEGGVKNPGRIGVGYGVGERQERELVRNNK